MEITPQVVAAFREAKLIELRQRRSLLLRECDWTQMPDAPLTAEQKTAWATYRQALRDLPEAAEDLDNVVWPVKP
ncbi:tail fiber assembly protein [Vogesella sp. XCS3]|uniref:tail fiber assembly protein n=1 Tax=Vogesella sp. XCS3 TaxID=2877939 RepID=UPI001D0B311D|nr:tail fiber assembly protein [Vogesella sp. XCS3]UDM18404.1 phage tail assembly chaperone [Vogesella sp. XCS3]